MPDILSIFRKLGFTDSGDEEMNEDERYEQDEEEDEEEDTEEEQEEGRGLFGFSFSIPGFSFGKKNAEDDEEEDEDEDEEDEDEEEPRPAKGKAPRASKVIDLKKSKERKSNDGQVSTGGVHCEHIFVVRQLQDSRTIITHLHEGDSVVLNLENIDPKDCGRVIDLLSGAAFALGGSITKVSRLTYLLAPGTVRVVPPQSAPPASSRFTM